MHVVATITNIKVDCGFFRLTFLWLTFMLAKGRRTNIRPGRDLNRNYATVSQWGLFYQLMPWTTEKNAPLEENRAFLYTRPRNPPSAHFPKRTQSTFARILWIILRDCLKLFFIMTFLKTKVRNLSQTYAH